MNCDNRARQQNGRTLARTSVEIWRIVKHTGTRGFLLRFCTALLVASGFTACGEDSPVQPSFSGPANIVFVGWQCCSQDCVPDFVGFDAIGRVRNMGAGTAYHVVFDVRPCSSGCNLTGSIARKDSLVAGETYDFIAIAGSPAGSCPWLMKVTWQDTLPIQPLVGANWPLLLTAPGSGGREVKDGVGCRSRTAER